MARFVDPQRLWPLLAYFVGAVTVVVGADFVLGRMDAEPRTMWIFVLVWLVVTPLGAWLLWKHGASSGGP
jgi:ABC-type Fe3+-siderophore transport system permease subunit